MSDLTTGQEARVARQIINRMVAEMMTSTGGYDDPANVAAAAARARDTALAFYQRGNIAGMVEDADPVLDPNVVFK